MSTGILPRPAVSGTKDDDWVHLFCDHDPDRALCGEDLTGVEEISAGTLTLEHDCPLCVVLVKAYAGICPECGR